MKKSRSYVLGVRDKLSSLYEAFDPEEAHRLREKLKLHYTLKHGSWLNIAEIGSPMHSL